MSVERDQVQLLRGNPGVAARTEKAAKMLAELLKHTAEAHHKYETAQGKPDDDWQGWYANHILSDLNHIKTILAATDSAVSAFEQTKKLTEPRVKVPMERLNDRDDLVLQCNSEDCRFKQSCANHRSAGDFRTEDGFTPDVIKEGDDYLCTQMVTGNAGALLGDMVSTVWSETEQKAG